jgi:hypothetical protein
MNDNERDEKILKMYYDGMMPIKEIERECHCSASFVKRVVRNSGREFRSAIYKRRTLGDRPDIAVAMYIAGKPICKICAETNISQWLLFRLIKEREIPLREPKKSKGKGAVVEDVKSKTPQELANEIPLRYFAPYNGGALLIDPRTRKCC